MNLLSNVEYTIWILLLIMVHILIWWRTTWRQTIGWHHSKMRFVIIEFSCSGCRLNMCVAVVIGWYLFALCALLNTYRLLEWNELLVLFQHRNLITKCCNLLQVTLSWLLWVFNLQKIDFGQQRSIRNIVVNTYRGLVDFWCAHWRNSGGFTILDKRLFWVVLLLLEVLIEHRGSLSDDFVTFERRRVIYGWYRRLFFYRHRLRTLSHARCITLKIVL